MLNSIIPRYKCTYSSTNFGTNQCGRFSELRTRVRTMVGQPRLMRQSRRRNTPTSPTLSHSLWRLEATSTGGPTSSWTPFGGPRGPAPPSTLGPRGTSGDRHPKTSGDAGSGSYPSLHRRHCSGDSRGRPRRRGSGVRAVARV